MRNQSIVSRISEKSKYVYTLLIPVGHFQVPYEMKWPKDCAVAAVAGKYQQSDIKCMIIAHRLGVLAHPPGEIEQG
jgi:hypothetical protein